jgi:hypothetical protein
LSHAAKRITPAILLSQVNTIGDAALKTVEKRFLREFILEKTFFVG